MSFTTKHCGKWPPDPRCSIRNVIISGTKIAGAAVRGKKVRVSDEVKKARMAICEACPHFHKKAKRCKKCGCFMGGVAGKVSWSTEACPAGKWGPVVGD